MNTKHLKGQNQSGLPGGPPGDKKDDNVYMINCLYTNVCLKDKKDKPKKWEPPLPTRVGKKRKKGPDSVNKLPAGSNYFCFLFQI